MIQEFKSTLLLIAVDGNNQIDKLAIEAEHTIKRLNNLINHTFQLKSPVFEDTDERCVNSVVTRIEEYTDIQTNRNPFSKSSERRSWSNSKPYIHSHKWTLENNNFSIPSDQSIEDIGMYSSEKK